MDEYMLYRLPNPVYENEVSRPNSSGSHWRQPVHVSLWSDFESKVLQWIEEQHEQHSQRIDPPSFVPITITEEVQTLQPFIKLNLLDVSSKCFNPRTEFKARCQVESCVGEPDHVMTRDGEIVAIVEDKGRWTLPAQDIVGNYNSSQGYTGVTSTVNQLYHYMRLNHRQFGILSSYESTWFVYRDQDCNVCDIDLKHETLFVTNGISFNRQNPTVLQCFSYFNTLVNSTRIDSPPASQNVSRSNSSLTLSNSTITRSSPYGSLSRALSTFPPIFSEPHDFGADDFRLNSLLGEGRSKVYLDEYLCQPIALKVSDVSKNPEMLSELLHEVLIYQTLSDLQGESIPEVLFHGYLEGILYCVGFSVCGRVPDIMSEVQKAALFNVLGKVHELGILHNDIKKENILVDENGRPFLIDFGFSAVASSLQGRENERLQLMKCLECW
jgi:hypothetical protein